MISQATLFLICSLSCPKIACFHLLVPHANNCCFRHQTDPHSHIMLYLTSKIAPNSSKPPSVFSFSKDAAILCTTTFANNNKLSCICCSLLGIILFFSFIPQLPGFRTGPQSWRVSPMGPIPFRPKTKTLTCVCAMMVFSLQPFPWKALSKVSAHCLFKTVLFPARSLMYIYDILEERKKKGALLFDC